MITDESRYSLTICFRCILIRKEEETRGLPYLVPVNIAFEHSFLVCIKHGNVNSLNVNFWTLELVGHKLTVFCIHSTVFKPLCGDRTDNYSSHGSLDISDKLSRNPSGIFQAKNDRQRYFDALLFLILFTRIFFQHVRFKSNSKLLINHFEEYSIIGRHPFVIYIPRFWQLFATFDV